MNAARLGQRWQVPVVVSIDAASPQAAIAAARALKALLDDPTILGLLRANMIDAQEIAVGSPIHGTPP